MTHMLLYHISGRNIFGQQCWFWFWEIPTFAPAPEGTISGMAVGVAAMAPTRRHHSWVSCLRGKHGGGLPTRRQQLVKSGWKSLTASCEPDQQLTAVLFSFLPLVFRMKQLPSCFRHRDSGDGRRGEAKEAGGRQSKGNVTTLSFSR